MYWDIWGKLCIEISEENYVLRYLRKTMYWYIRGKLCIEISEENYVLRYQRKTMYWDIWGKLCIFLVPQATPLNTPLKGTVQKSEFIFFSPPVIRLRFICDPFYLPLPPSYIILSNLDIITKYTGSVTFAIITLAISNSCHKLHVPKVKLAIMVTLSIITINNSYI